jgi:malonyl-CoA/methylmalonyl-CoA synthetase
MLINYAVTLLSIFANNAIAVPMSPAFPASELRYIVNQSEALTLLATEKFQAKASEVVKEGIEHPFKATTLPKIEDGGLEETSVSLEALEKQESGLMLYTSGTTNRPVSRRIDLAISGPS